MTYRQPIFIRNNLYAGSFFLLIVSLIFAASCSRLKKFEPIPFSKVRTIADDQEKFGEPFGIAVRDGEIFVSDGAKGQIRRVSNNQISTVVTDQLHTPSGIAFDQNGDLIVADAGTHTIKKVNPGSGKIEPVAGVENQKGAADGEARVALFNAPVGVAVLNGKIYVTDTYNDRIRVIENGRVLTLAGGEQGYREARGGASAQFDTPCGLAVWKDRLLVADTGNRRLRVIESDGSTWTLAGSGADAAVDGTPAEASFVEPLAVTVDAFSGVIYVADGNSIRAIGRRFVPLVETLTGTKRGFADGDLRAARFNRPSGLAGDDAGNLFVADAENQAVRVLTGAEISTEISIQEAAQRRVSAADFRQAGEPRWTYQPPDRKREIAGTLGEIRGEIVDDNSTAWFHNGLDIVGDYGETARFIRSEKVLQPLAVGNFNTQRELIRMPNLGYIHIRLGRDQDDKIYADRRFQFSRDGTGKLSGVRIPRGAEFAAGDAVGTLNALNHVHLIAGRAGAEMNALDALRFPGIADAIVPVIENVALYDENWRLLGETQTPSVRIKLNGRTRIVVSAYDRMDGNAERRRLGVYKIGYQVLRADQTPVSDINWTISFERSPDPEAVKYVYAAGSKSGATGATLFRYIASNRVNGDAFREDFFDAESLAGGDYILRVFAADFFGNTTSEDVNFVR